MINNPENQQKARLDGQLDIKDIQNMYPKISDQIHPLSIKIEEFKAQKKELEFKIEQITANMFKNTMMTEAEIDTYMEKNHAEDFLKYDYLSYRNRELVMYKDKISYSQKLNMTIG